MSVVLTLIAIAALALCVLIWLISRLRADARPAPSATVGQEAEPSVAQARTASEVAAQTLSDLEYQRMRVASLAILEKIGVETGGSNVQFAVNPQTGRLIVIEMNPRVSRSSALASKATGFPIAKIAATKQEEEGKSSASHFEGITMDSDTILKGEVVEMTLKTGIKTAKLEDKQADDLLLEMAFNNVDANWINQVVEMSKRKNPLLAAAGEAGDGEDTDDQQSGDLREKMLKSLTQALARQPVIELKRLSMRTPDGVSEFAAAVQYLGDGEKMGTLLQDLKVSLKADMPKPFMENMMLSRRRSSLLAVFEGESEYKPEDIEEAAKAPANQENQHAAVIADRGQHLLDDIHALGVKGKVVGEDGRNDDQQDRPAGEGNTFEECLDRM